jgi:uncharacterized protein
MKLVPHSGAGDRQAATMESKKTRLEIVARGPARTNKTAGGAQTRTPPPQVSGRWLLFAVGGTIAAAALCAWGALCLLFWQGSWQLLYRPAAAIGRTPSSTGLAFDPIGFASTEEGTPRLKGWWIPAADGAPFSRFTVLYLHGQNGNLGDTVDALDRLHRIGVNILAFDYRGYGLSEFVRPSEAHWRQDADWALQYLTGTRHVTANSIVLDGEGLGANLALEMGAAHRELAGVVLESPIESPMDAVFNDARARLVPARLLVRDRYDLSGAAAGLEIPALWIEGSTRGGQVGSSQEPEAYKKITARKSIVWLSPSANEKQFVDAISRWLDDLPHR